MQIHTVVIMQISSLKYKSMHAVYTVYTVISTCLMYTVYTYVCVHCSLMFMFTLSSLLTLFLAVCMYIPVYVPAKNRSQIPCMCVHIPDQ